LHSPARRRPVNAGVLAALDAPAINARGDIVFLAGLRRGRETLEAVLIASGGRLRKVVAQGDPAPSGGSFAAFGPPTIDRDGAVAFGAAIEGRSVPGGIFIWKADQLRMVLGAGDESPIGGIFAKFSERIGFGDHGTVVFHGQLKGAPTVAGIFAIRDGRTQAVGPLGRRGPGRRPVFELRAVARGQREGNHRLHRGGGRWAEPGHRGAHDRQRTASRRQRRRQRAWRRAHRIA
jgi:hypothetical protein